jgi:hypothetical protein
VNQASGLGLYVRQQFTKKVDIPGVIVHDQDIHPRSIRHN